MGKTAIQWTDETVNPIRARRTDTGAVGHYCEKISPECRECYAHEWNTRCRPIRNKAGETVKFVGTGLGFDVRHKPQLEMFLDESVLDKVARTRAPKKVFWCDMTDIFGSWVPDEWLDLIFAVMALTPHLTHQVLTKRPDRMRAYFTAVDEDTLLERWAAASMTMTLPLDTLAREQVREGGDRDEAESFSAERQWSDVRNGDFPLQHVWLGMSAGLQQTADAGAPHLAALALQGWTTWVSAEPMLERVDYRELLAFIKWIVFGGESGRRARPCDLSWLERGVTEATGAGVPAFMKQVGSVPMIGEASWRAGDGGGRVRLLNALNHRRVPDGFVPLKFADKKGGDIAEFPPQLQVRYFPPFTVPA